MSPTEPKRSRTELQGRSTQDVIESARSRKRSKHGSEFPVSQFVENFCAQNGLIPEVFIGTYECGIKCIQNAKNAREEFQDMVDAKEPEEDVASFLPEQKYDRRLRNNRKSAASTKVFTAVLRRELITALRNVSPENANSLEGKVRVLEEETIRLLQDETNLKSALSAERQRLNDFRGLCLCNSKHTTAPRTEEVQIQQLTNCLEPNPEGQYPVDSSEQQAPCKQTLSSHSGPEVSNLIALAQPLNVEHFSNTNANGIVGSVVANTEHDQLDFALSTIFPGERAAPEKYSTNTEMNFPYLDRDRSMQTYIERIFDTELN